MRCKGIRQTCNHGNGYKTKYVSESERCLHATAGEVLSLLEDSSRRVRNWEGRTEVSLELAERLLLKAQDAFSSVQPLEANIEGLRFVALDHGKKCLTKKFGASWGFRGWKDAVKQFWRESLVGNLGVVCGEYQDRFLVVVDIDAKASRSISVQGVVEGLGISTFMVSTPSGGKHLYFWSTKKVGCPRSFSPVGVDIKGEGGYVVAPGSSTSKGFYSWDVDNQFFSQEVASLPSDWEERLEFLFSGEEALRRDGSRGRREKDCIEGPLPLTTGKQKRIGRGSQFSQGKRAPVGSRNAHITRRAGALVHRSKTLKDLERSLLKVRNLELSEPETFSDKEVQEIAAWVWNKDKGNRGRREKDCIEGPHEECPVNSHAKSLELFPSAFHVRFRSQGAVTDNLIEFLSTLPKEEEHSTAMVEVASLVQAYFQSMGFRYSKAIHTKAVGGILQSAGFTKKRVQLNGERNKLWNIGPLSLQKLQEWLSKPRTLEALTQELKARSKANSAANTNHVQTSKEECSHEAKETSKTPLLPSKTPSDPQGPIPVHGILRRLRSRSAHLHQGANPGAEEDLDLSERLGRGDGNGHPLGRFGGPAQALLAFPLRLCASW